MLERIGLKEGFRAVELWHESQYESENNIRRTSEKGQQEMNKRPILFGCDVVGLYANLDQTSVAKEASVAAINSKVVFKGINYYLLTF